MTRTYTHTHTYDMQAPVSVFFTMHRCHTWHISVYYARKHSWTKEWPTPWQKRWPKPWPKPHDAVSANVAVDGGEAVANATMGM